MPRYPQRKAIVVSICLLRAMGSLLAGMSLGCASSIAQSRSRPAAPDQTDLAALRQTPAFQRAASLYQRHDYAAAQSVIGSLLADPHRSSEERRFLLRQKQICQKALTSPGASVTHTRTIFSRQSQSVSAVDCGPRALMLVCQREHIPADLTFLRQSAGTSAAKGGTSLEGLAKAAKALGFTAQGVQMDRDALANLKTPAIAWVEGNHYIAVLSVQRSLLGADRDSALIHDPNHDREEVIPLSELLRRSGGVMLTLMLTPKRSGA